LLLCDGIAITVSDVFEEGWLGGSPFYGGYGLLTVNGVAKPAYRYALCNHLIVQFWLGCRPFDRLVLAGFQWVHL